MKINSCIASLLTAAACHAEIGIIAEFVDGNIYSFDPSDPSIPATLIISGLSEPDLVSFSPDGSRVYIPCNSSFPGFVYTFPTLGPYSPNTLNLGMGVSDPISVGVLEDGETALVSTNTSGLFYFSIPGPDHTAVPLTAATTPISSPIPIAMNGNTAYVGNYPSLGVYSVTIDTVSNMYTATSIDSLSSFRSAGLAVSSDGYLYATDALAANVYRVPLSDLSQTATLVAQASSGVPYIDGIAVSGDGKTVFIASNDEGIYTFPTDMGFPQSYATTSLGVTSLYGLGISFSSSPPATPMIPTATLSGNDLSLANYLNREAPSSTIALFSSLTGSALAAALERAAPTRNALITFSSQNGYLAASQALSDHGRQKRFHTQSQGSSVASLDVPIDELMADASGRVQTKTNCLRSSYTIWMTPFGEYAREKKQMQTPAFSMGVGGALAAFEYSGENDNSVGFGGAYAYTHIHEEEGMGSANLNQGLITIYTALRASKWYFDFGIWGGYYASKNQRKIAFSTVRETARSHLHGWQLAPHLEVGYDGFWRQDCTIARFDIEPFVMGDWVANWEHALREHGASELNMGQKGRFCSFFRGETGLRFIENATFSWGHVVFREKGSYAYQKAFHTGEISAFLLGSPGSFTLSTLTGAQNLGVIEASMLFVSSNSKTPYVDLRYQGEFGSRYQSHQGMLEIGKSF